MIKTATFSSPVLVLLSALSCSVSVAEETFAIRGLAVYGRDDESNVPLVLDGKITIQFDVLADLPPTLKVRFYHCNRDWAVDKSSFINNESRNTSSVLGFTPSANGVRGYTYRYTNSFSDGDFVVFEHSGNWIFRIMDKDLTVTYAEERFFVVENSALTKVVVTNEYLTAQRTPYNQVHQVVARVTLPSEIEGQYFTTVDVYQNRRFHHAYRIDAWDRDPYTRVEGFNTGKRAFTIRNIMPGNEYRTLDISSATKYPNFQQARSLDGADLMRVFWRTGSDRNGESVLNRFTGLHSDYIDYLFRLDLTSRDHRALTADGRDIFVVGEFNFWNPTSDDKLVFDDGERSYIVRKWLRRGMYDYQYVTGTWNPGTGIVEQQDWLAVEGNDVRTVNTYTVFVYYNDPRFGGFDRIVGVGQAKSPGTFTFGSN